LLSILAQATTNPAATAQPNFIQQIVPLIPFIIIAIVFFWLTSGSKRKQEKTRKAMIEALKRGDRIQTVGGILGTIVSADGNEIVVKVDESTNTKMRFTRSAIFQVITEETKAETK
jgi:preprotein translocase subunit YajC